MSLSRDGAFGRGGRISIHTKPAFGENTNEQEGQLSESSNAQGHGFNGIRGRNDLLAAIGNISGIHDRGDGDIEIDQSMDKKTEGIRGTSIGNRGIGRGSRGHGSFVSPFIRDTYEDDDSSNVRGGRGRGSFGGTNGRGSFGEGRRRVFENERGLGASAIESGRFSGDCGRARDRRRNFAVDDALRSNPKNLSACRRCGEDGHMARECTKQEAGVPGGEHMRRSRDVPRRGLSDRGYTPEIRPTAEILQEDTTHAKEYSEIADQDCDIIVTAKEGPDTDPIKKWADFPFEQVIKDNIADAKYLNPRKIQAYAIPYIMKGRDVLVHAETGSGKTAAYMIPIIDYILKKRVHDGTGYKSTDKSSVIVVPTPSALILAPTKELVQQICEQGVKYAKGTNVTVKFIIGGANLNQLYMGLIGSCDILVGTPGIVKYLVQKGEISVKGLRFFILDEADRMLDDKRILGREENFSFVDCIQVIRSIHGFPSMDDIVMVLVSATFSDDVQDFADKNLFKESRVYITNTKWIAANMRIKHTIIPTNGQDKFDKAIAIIRSELERQDPKEARSIIAFVNSVRRAALFTFMLLNAEIDATVLTGEKTTQDRDLALKDFRSNRYKVMVASDVLARGIDIKACDHVINVDIPADKREEKDYQLTTFIHRIGRTGRIRTGFATTLFDSTDRNDQTMAPKLVKLLTDVDQPVPEFLKEMQSVNNDQLQTITSTIRGKFASERQNTTEETSVETSAVSVMPGNNLTASRPSLRQRGKKIEISTDEDSKNNVSATTVQQHHLSEQPERSITPEVQSIRGHSRFTASVEEEIEKSKDVQLANSIPVVDEPTAVVHEPEMVNVQHEYVSEKTTDLPEAHHRLRSRFAASAEKELAKERTDQIHVASHSESHVEIEESSEVSESLARNPIESSTLPAEPIKESTLIIGESSFDLLHLAQNVDMEAARTVPGFEVFFQAMVNKFNQAKTSEVSTSAHPAVALEPERKEEVSKVQEKPNVIEKLPTMEMESNPASTFRHKTKSDDDWSNF